MLQCELDSENIDACWTKDGIVLDDSHPNSSRINITCSGKVHTLKVINLVDSDSGVYTFAIGQKQCSSNIFVEGSLR